MTISEFLDIAKTFKSGHIYAISGQDINEVMNLLYLAETAIQSTGRQAVIYDFRCRPVSDPVKGGCAEYADEGTPPTRRWLGDAPVQSLLWESYSLLVQRLSDAGNPMVMLVGNTFDPEDRRQNPSPISLEIDVIMEWMSMRNLRTVIAANGKAPLSGSIRELFQFLTQIYFYDTNTFQVTFIKDQIRQRPYDLDGPKQITVVSPGNFYTLKRNKNLHVIWNNFNILPSTSVKVDLYQNSLFVMNLAFTAPNSEVFDWKIPLWMNVGTNYSVRVSLLDDLSVFGDSGLFSII